MMKLTIALLIPLALACGSEAPDAVMVDEEATEPLLDHFILGGATPSQARILVEAARMEEGMALWFGEKGSLEKSMTLHGEELDIVKRIDLPDGREAFIVREES